MTFETKDDFLKCVRNELVPENPKTSEGLVGLLEYRINASEGRNKRHPDSLYEGYDEKKGKYYGKSITSECFNEIYGIDPFLEGSSDTIFNCWSYISIFVRGRLNKRYINEKNILENLNTIFYGYENVRFLLDKLANYQHSMANLMPAPIGFNGSKSHDGKGNYKKDNDMPDIYYLRAKYDFPEMYKWINDKMELYKLSFFRDYESGFSDGVANVSIRSDEEIELLIKSIINAIDCIEKRAGKLAKMVENP